MRKTIAAINLTIDGYYDHDILTPDGEIHQHFTELLNSAGVLVYGRISYELMEFWRPMVENPSGEKSMDDFAKAMDNVPKIIFSNTLTHVSWHSATLATQPLEETIVALKQQPGNDILICSPSLIVALSQQGLIDEYQLCVHPVIAGSGLSLFSNITNRTVLKLVQTKQLSGGAIILYYEVPKP